MNALAIARPCSPYSEPRVTISAPRKIYRVEADASTPDEESVDEAIQNWLDQTSLMSSIDDMLAVPSFDILVDYGYAALPKIIDHMDKEPSLLGLAAAKIVGDSPITDKIRGDVRAMTGAWIGWYQRAKRDFV